LEFLSGGDILIRHYVTLVLSMSGVIRAVLRYIFMMLYIGKRMLYIFWSAMNKLQFMLPMAFLGQQEKLVQP